MPCMISARYLLGKVVSILQTSQWNWFLHFTCSKRYGECILWLDWYIFTRMVTNHQKQMPAVKAIMPITKVSTKSAMKQQGRPPTLLTLPLPASLGSCTDQPGGSVSVSSLMTAHLVAGMLRAQAKRHKSHIAWIRRSQSHHIICTTQRRQKFPGTQGKEWSLLYITA